MHLMRRGAGPLRARARARAPTLCMYVCFTIYNLLGLRKECKNK